MTPRQLLVRSTIWLVIFIVTCAGLWLVYRLFFDVHGIEPITQLESMGSYQKYAALRGSKHIALTFDDGPRPIHTEAILDILDTYHAPATFFLVGESVMLHPTIAQHIVTRGYAVALHSFTHGLEVHQTKKRVEWELSATRYAIETVTGVTPRLYRPPFQLDIASTVTDLWKVADSPLEWVFKYGYIPVGAEPDSYDWVLTDADDIVTQVQLNLSRGNVLVFHDTEHTAEALPRVLMLLRNEGYEIVPLDELVGVPGIGSQQIPRTGFMSFVTHIDRVVVFGGALALRVVLSLLTIVIVLVLLRLLLVASLLRLSYKRVALPSTKQGQAIVSIIIPAWNEEKNIEATMKSVIESRGVKAEVIVVDDGSTDRTFEIASRVARETASMRVSVLRKKNGGKASALNAGIARARGVVMVFLDADTIFTEDTVFHLVAPFRDPLVGAVSGKVSIADASSVLTRMQQLEYMIGQNVQKRAFQMANAMSVIPGAVGAWRKRDIRLVGGVPADTLVEDHDLTLAILKLGRRIVYEPRATAFTEAPRTISAFIKQRTRWVHGAMQCAMKYRAALWSRRASLGMRLALVNAFAYDLFLPFFYPIVDLIFLGSIVTGTFSTMALPLLLFLLLDFGTVYLAMIGEEKKEYTLVTMLLMRLTYRHLLFYAFVVSLVRFFEGRSVGWQKLERTGDAQRLYFKSGNETLVDNAVSGHLPPLAPVPKII